MSAPGSRAGSLLPDSVSACLTERRPLLWINEQWSSIRKAGSGSALNMADVHEADRQLQRFSALLVELFPQLASSAGIIESELHGAGELQRSMVGSDPHQGRWLVKGDHALPIAGSIKARGGFYEVLLHAQEL